MLFAGCVLLQNWSIELIGAGVATVVCNLQVLVVAVGGWWLFAEKPPRRLLLALPAALLGVVMVSGIVGGQEFGSDAGLGVLAGLANSLCYGAFLLVLRHAQSRGDGNTVVMLRDVVAVACAVCLSAVAAGGFAHGGLSPSALGLLPSWPAHGWMLLLALGPQVLGWLMITSALPRLPVAVSGLLLLLQPMIAMTLSMILLGEKPSTVQLTGCALLMLAIAGGVLGGRSPRPEPSITEPDETGAASPAAVEPATRTAPPAVTGAT
ncbi:MAG: DMT family transporter [Stackebrandtia sp.]